MPNSRVSRNAGRIPADRLARKTNADAESGEPIGGFWVRWHDPTDDQATIWKVEWDPAEGGSEEEVWRAVEVLAGGPVPR